MWYFSHYAIKYTICRYPSLLRHINSMVLVDLSSLPKCCIYLVWCSIHSMGPRCFKSHTVATGHMVSNTWMHGSVYVRKCYYQSVLWLGYRPDDWGSIPGRGGEGIFLLATTFRPALGPAHPASYPVGTRGCFCRVKVARMWSWPLTSI
jgi:hypothetical protein